MPLTAALVLSILTASNLAACDASLHDIRVKQTWMLFHTTGCLGPLLPGTTIDSTLHSAHNETLD